MREHRRCGRPTPESSGSPASFCAICTWNGLIGLNAAPTPAAPTLIATAVSASNPSRRVTSSSTGTSAMISSDMFSSAPPAANASETIGITSASRRCSRRTSHPTACRSAPGFVHHGEGAADQEDEEDDRASVGQPFRDRDQCVEDADRPRRHDV